MFLFDIVARKKGPPAKLFATFEGKHTVSLMNICPGASVI